MKRFKLPSPAMMVACIALAVAMSGASYAAVVLPKNSVRAKQIAPNAVGPSEIKTGAVRSSEVRDGSLSATDFAPGQLGSSNADTLDGVDSTGFYRAGSKVADSETVDGVDSTGFYGAGSKVADSETLDGVDSTGFYGAGSKVADSEMLDGVDSAGYQRRCVAGGLTAYAYVDVSDVPDATYVNLNDSRFTCANSTNTVRAKRTSSGDYTVDFGYNYAGLLLSCPEVAVGTIAGTASSINVHPSSEGGITGDCVYNVELFNPAAETNVDFVLAQLDTGGSTVIILP